MEKGHGHMTDGSIRVSIVVPIYNVAAYLERCIDSIVHQTYKDIEIILVDDGSTDDGSGICDSYAKADSRVLVIHKRNGGLVSARKAGTAAATGDYILNVDGDDWIEKDRVEALVHKGIMSGRPDMVYLCGGKKEYGNTTILMESDAPQKMFYGEEVRTQVFPLLRDAILGMRVATYLWAWAVKRELLQEKQELVDEGITIAEDAVCVWFCLLTAEKVMFVKQDGYHYVQRADSMCYSAAASPEHGVFRVKICYRQLKRYLETCGISREIWQLFHWLTIREIMMADYGLLLRRHTQYLYPFKKVQRGSRIVVYGAGRTGVGLMRYLSGVQDYEVVLWVDENWKENVLPGHRIGSLEDMEGSVYDYVVIAVMYEDMAREMEEVLRARGIPGEKIAVMDADVITEDAIPDEITRESVICQRNDYLV